MATINYKVWYIHMYLKWDAMKNTNVRICSFKYQYKSIIVIAKKNSWVMYIYYLYDLVFFLEYLIWLLTH